jgi:hypothetical protein
LQVGIEFFAAAADGIDVQAGNESEQGIAAVACFLGLQGGEPTALLLVEATDEEVDLVVEFTVGMILLALAVGAGTGVNHVVGHDESSVRERGKLRRTLYEKVLEVILGRALNSVRLAQRAWALIWTPGAVKHGRTLCRRYGLEAPYWRGVVDGDGWLSDHGRKWRIGLCGQRTVLQNFRGFLTRSGIISQTIPYRGRGMWLIEYAGRELVRQIVGLLYPNNAVALPRKYEVAQRILSTPPTPRAVLLARQAALFRYVRRSRGN